MNGIGADAARVWLIRLGIVIAVALLLGRLGPFGTFSDLSPVERYSYWVGLTLLMWVQSVTALAMLKGAKLRLGRAPRVVIAALLGSIPTAFEVAWSEMLLRVERDLSLVDVVKILGDVCLLSVPLLLATHLLVRSNEPPNAEEQQDEGIDWLLSRLEPQRRGRLIALQSEDHYVRVRTTGGSQLVHMRFGDAVRKVRATAGCQVHRSWWVASDAVRAQMREGDRIILELIDGTRVPVSRSHALAARQAGLLAAG